MITKETYKSIKDHCLAAQANGIKICRNGFGLLNSPGTLVAEHGYVCAIGAVCLGEPSTENASYVSLAARKLNSEATLADLWNFIDGFDSTAEENISREYRQPEYKLGMQLAKELGI